MSEVLDQDEVNALLEAVEGGEIEFDLAEEEVQATEEVYLYDFKRPERVSKDQLRAIETLHEVFARNFSASLSAYMRTIVELKLVSVEQLTYSEFILSLPNPTCFNLLNAPPLEGELVMELNHSIVFPIIDRLLGGGQDASTVVVDRPLTDIEWSIIGGILGRALEQLSEIWTPIQEGIAFRVASHETNPQLMQIVAPNEPVVLICFELTMGESSGMVNICIPFMVIEPNINDFSQQAWFAYVRATHEDDRVRLAATLSGAPVEVVCLLADTSIKLQDLLELEVGDVLQTTQSADAPATLLIENRSKFIGRAGVMNKHMAFRIQRPVAPSDHK